MLRKESKKIILFLIVVFIAIGLCFNPGPFYVILAPLMGEWSSGQIRFSVTSTPDDRPIFTFDQRSLEYERHPFATFLVDDIRATKEASKAKQRFVFCPVWHLEQDFEHWKVPVYTVTYGVCPPGFKEVVPAAPLEIGKIYRVCGSNDILLKKDFCKYEIVHIPPN